MTDATHRLAGYVEHLLKARTRHAVHSPFVYALVEQVLRPRGAADGAQGIEDIRAGLLLSKETISVTDLGAGSRATKGQERSVASIARTALMPARQAQMLFRLARFLDARRVLELGTSFGLTSLYLAHGAPDAQVVTIEGCPRTHAIARRHFDLLGAHRIHALLGPFERMLPEALEQLGAVDLVLVDGHHAELPTLAYFEACMGHVAGEAVFVFDDIRWSRGMERAWQAVKGHPRVTVTIDLFDLGLVFVRPGQAREHFRLRY